MADEPEDFEKRRSTPPVICYPTETLPRPKRPRGRSEYEMY